eukprot:GHVN01062114.1.p1 GENE.GHVN01062114.1~~GHVN01062114.1.p1  ORF type:complete len:491 (+),score=35.63 GHVN01062114.1:335-1807(+)
MKPVRDDDFYDQRGPADNNLTDVVCDCVECPCDWCGCQEIAEVCCPGCRVCEACGGPCCACCQFCAVKEEMTSYQLARNAAKVDDTYMRELQKIRGLSSATLVNYDPSSNEILEELRQKQRARRKIVEICGMSGGSFSNVCSVATWLSVYGLVLTFLILRAYQLFHYEEGQLENFLKFNERYVHNFHWFFAIATVCICGSLVIGFIVARVLFGLVVTSVIFIIVEGIRYEVLMNSKWTIEKDFEDYKNRLRYHFDISEDFFKNSSQKILRTVHFRIDRVAELMDYANRNPGLIREAVSSRICCLKHTATLFIYLLPATLAVTYNIALVVHVIHLRYRYDHYVEMSHIYAFWKAPMVELHREAFQYLNRVMLCCLFAWLWLVAISSRILQRWFIKRQIDTIKTAAVIYTNQQLVRVWENYVVKEVVHHIKSHKKPYHMDDTLEGGRMDGGIELSPYGEDVGTGVPPSDASYMGGVDYPSQRFASMMHTDYR